MNDAKRVKRRSGGRNAYFFIGFYKIWRENIHSIIKILHNNNSINWLYTQMPYHRFTNLGRFIKGYFVVKLLKGLTSKEFFDRKCN